MRTFRGCMVVGALMLWASPRGVAGAAADFDFSISYSGQSISGRLIGLNLDANGNASEIDPTSVELFHVPTIVGLSASPSQPYVFVPHTYERSTYFSGTFSSTTPNVYGFQVSNYTLNPASQNLLMSDSGGDVTMVFNFGAGLCGECGVATYGIQGEEDALWPAVNSLVSFAIVSPPGDINRNGVVDDADYVAWRKNGGAAADYNSWRANFGISAASGSGITTTTAPEPAAMELAELAVFFISVAMEMRRRVLVKAQRLVRDSAGR